MQLAPGKLALCLRLACIFEREPPSRKCHHMPQGDQERTKAVEWGLSEKEPCGNGPNQGEKNPESLGSLFATPNAQGKG